MVNKSKRLHINYLKILAQDYPFGKWVSMTYSLMEMLLILVQNPRRSTLNSFGAILKIKPNYSMLSTKRLMNLERLVTQAHAQGLKGDVAECGVWNGGAAAMMAQALKKSEGTMQTKVWLFDSFEGLPPPKEEYDQPQVAQCYYTGMHKGSYEKILDVMSVFNVPMSQVHIVKGWMQDTLPKCSIGPVALLHIDTDWYESVTYALDFFYDRMVEGGYIVVDDFWFFPGCRRAVYDFLKKRQLMDRVTLHRVDRSAVYFQVIKSAT